MLRGSEHHQPWTTRPDRDRSAHESTRCTIPRTAPAARPPGPRHRGPPIRRTALPRGRPSHSRIAPDSGPRRPRATGNSAGPDEGESSPPSPPQRREQHDTCPRDTARDRRSKRPDCGQTPRSIAETQTALGDRECWGVSDRSSRARPRPQPPSVQARDRRRPRATAPRRFAQTSRSLRLPRPSAPRR